MMLKLYLFQCLSLCIFVFILMSWLLSCKWLNSSRLVLISRTDRSSSSDREEVGETLYFSPKSARKRKPQARTSPIRFDSIRPRQHTNNNRWKVVIYFHFINKHKHLTFLAYFLGWLAGSSQIGSDRLGSVWAVRPSVRIDLHSLFIYLLGDCLFVSWLAFFLLFLSLSTYLLITVSSFLFTKKERKRSFLKLSSSCCNHFSQSVSLRDERPVSS